MTKQAKQAPKEAPSESRLLDQALASLERGVTAIDAAISAAAKKVHGKSGKGYDKDAASHLAWLTKQAAQIAGEVRKCEVHDQAQARKLSVRVVLDWYKAMSEDERADLRRRLADIDGGRSILAL